MLKLVERLYVALAGVWLFILVWTFVLGLDRVPAWNGFVLWYSSFQPEFKDFTSFMDKLRGVFDNLKTISGEDLQRISNPDVGETQTIFSILAVIFDIGIVFLRSVGTLFVGGVTVIVNTIVYVIPQVSAFVAFLTGSYFANTLPGAGGVIDWSAQSGWLGYPDQSFAGLVQFVPCLVG